MDPNEIQTTININTITSYLVTLYAVVPSIVITMMYTFLSETEEDVACLWQEIKQKGTVKIQKCAMLVYRFIIISSKMFHLSMAYYLAMLLTSLFSKCMGWQPISVTNAFLVASVLYSVYSITYIILDARVAITAVFKNSYYKRYLWIFWIVIQYTFSPLALAIYLKLRNQREEALHLFWITLTIVHLSFWWWLLPFLYQPLTNLSYIRRHLEIPQKNTITHP